MSLGTGKTLIGVKIAYWFVQRNTGSGKQVLFCGPSNYSVDVVAGNCCMLLDLLFHISLKIIMVQLLQLIFIILYNCINRMLFVFFVYCMLCSLTGV